MSFEGKHLLMQIQQQPFDLLDLVHTGELHASTEVVATCVQDKPWKSCHGY